MSANLLNVAERAFAASRPPANQTPVNAATVSGARESAGVGGVPNALAAAAAGPYGAILGGVADAIGAPPPSLTSTVNANPQLRYGDRYMPNLVGSSKAGSSFVVTSGSSEAKSEAGSAETTGTSKLNVWIVAAIAGFVALVFFIRK